MKNLFLLLIVTVLFQSCKKEEVSNRLYIEFSGFNSFGLHQIFLHKKNGPIILDNAEQPGNTYVVADANEGDIIEGSFSITGPGTITVKQKGKIKLLLHHSASTKISGEITPFTVD